MKKDKRYLYYLLTGIDLPQRVAEGSFKGTWNISLCHFCKHAEWTGGSCCESELDCQFPEIGLFGMDIRDNSCDVWCGSGDCSGFAPAYRREDCVDIVGLYLQGLWPDWNSISRDKEPNER